MFRRSFVAALVVAACCMPSSAQQSALEPPPLENYLRWGPLRVRPGFELRDFGHDDNVFSSNVDPQGDFTATLAPKIDGLLLLGHRGFITFRERLGYTIYRDHSDQNYVDQQGTARLTVPFRRMGLFVDGLYNRLKERPVDQQDIRTDRDEEGLGLGLIWQPGWRTEFELGRAHKQLSFFDEDASPTAPLTVGDRLDRSEQRNTLEVRYNLMGRTRLTLFTLYSTIEFDNAVSSARDAREWSLLPGINFGVGGALSGSVRLGWTRLDTRDPTVLDFDDVVGRAELAFRPVSRLTLRVDAAREPGFTLSDVSAFYLDTQARLRAVYYLSRIVGIEAGGSVGRVEFPRAAGPERQDELSGYEGGLRFRLAENSLGRRLEYSLRLQRSRRDSNIDSQDRTQTTIGLNAVVGF